MNTSSPQHRFPALRPGRRAASRAKLLATSLAIAVVGIFVVSSAQADTQSEGQVEVLELGVRNDDYESNDIGPKGPSLGDEYIYSGAAMKGDDVVGFGGGTCQILQVAGEKITTQCLITLELDRGSLTMQSLWISGSNALDMAITGGTGDFKSARGTATYWDIGTDKERVRAEILRK